MMENASYALALVPLTFITLPPVTPFYLMLKDFIPEKKTVLKLQVGLLGTYRSLHKDDTFASNDLSYVLQEVTLGLLRHPSYCISGYSSVDVARCEFKCVTRLNYFFIEERSLFDVVNANNISKTSATSESSDEYIVVTIIMYVMGECKLPPVKSITQLKIALETLACIPSRYILSDEVFWRECLTEEELLQDYPLLHPL